MYWFTVARYIPLLIVFGVAAYQDFKKGEVSNRVWLYAPFGLALTLIELFVYSPFLWSYTLVSMIFTAVFGLILFYFTKEFGGADAKALITLSVSFPLGGFLLFYPFAALVFAGFLVGLKYLFSRHRKSRVRYIPYLFIGMLIALV
jgi:Flp pilus assembly protein protease CpaA